MKWTLWTPDAIASLVIVLGCIVLMGMGIDGDIKGILGIAAGWLFGGSYHKVRTVKELAKANGKKEEGSG
jgi:hypothetical protein